MSPDERDEEDVEAIAAEVSEGRDAYVLPDDLVHDAEEKKAPPSLNLRARITAMKVGERLKLALKGNRDARSILIRDSSRLVQKFVLQNPRISEEEVIALAKNRSAERELIDIIAKKKEWLANYQVRLALVTNPKTPLATAVRYIPTLLARDLRLLAKSKNVPTAISGLARRLVIERSSGKG